MNRPLILVTNDDGISAPGIAALAGALEALGEVWVYAPDREQSAVGHGISLHRPLRIRQLKKRWYLVDGTPTDCIMLAVHGHLDRPPDLVVSGINNGANLGDDVTYSGTVAGAHEGMLLGFPSMAISNVSFTPEHFDATAQVARYLAAHLLEQGIPEDTLLNVNVPDRPYSELAGIEITRMGRGAYNVDIVERKDPRGVKYYWIGGSQPTERSEVGTDFEAIDRGIISVTPLHRDFTNRTALDILKQRNLSIPPG